MSGVTCLRTVRHRQSTPGCALGSSTLDITSFNTSWYYISDVVKAGLLRHLLRCTVCRRQPYHGAQSVWPLFPAPYRRLLTPMAKRNESAEQRAERKQAKKAAKDAKRLQRRGLHDPSFGQKPCTLCGRSRDLLIRYGQGADCWRCRQAVCQGRGAAFDAARCTVVRQCCIRMFLIKCLAFVMVMSLPIPGAP